MTKSWKLVKKKSDKKSRTSEKKVLNQYRKE